MAFFSYLDENSDITDITFNDRPRLGPLDKASQKIMRGKSAFSEAEREMMAAYVSGLNACAFCHGSHKAVADQFGISPRVIEVMIEDIDSAPIKETLKPVFHYLKKLTLSASKLTETDVEKVFAAGWTEDALHEAILVGCLFNFYNRLLDGHGIKGNQNIYQFGGEHLANNGYVVPLFIGLMKKTIKKNKLKRLQELEKQHVPNHSTQTKVKMKQNILVIGGTGKTGRRVAEGLSQSGHNVKIGSRKGSPAFDWEDYSTFAPALRGMDRAYIVYYPDLAVPGAKDAIKALTDTALKAGLEKVVLLSGKGEAEAEACEQIVANSGLNYTLVRASWFNQNFSEGAFLDFVLAGKVALPMPEAEIPFVDADDIADVVTTVLVDDAYNGETITVTGPEKQTFGQAVEMMERAIGREIQYIPITIDEFKEGMKAAGLPDSYVWLFGYLFEEVLGNPDNQEVSDDVERVLGRRATSFEEFAQKTAATGVWNQAVSEII